MQTSSKGLRRENLANLMGECDRPTIGNSSRLPAGYIKLQRWLARQPAAATGVKPFDFRSFEPGHILFDGIANAGLKISQMTVAFGKLAK